MKQRKCCDTCDYWMAHEYSDYVETLRRKDGICRRFPPVLISMNLGLVCDYNDNPSHDEVVAATDDWRMWGQPATCFDHFCGEWRAQEGTED